MSNVFYMVKVFQTKNDPIVAEFPEYDDARKAYNSFVFEGEKEVHLIKCEVVCTDVPKKKPVLATDLRERLMKNQPDFKKEYECDFTPSKPKCEHVWGEIDGYDPVKVYTRGERMRLESERFPGFEAYEYCPDCGAYLVDLMAEAYGFKEIK